MTFEAKSLHCVQKLETISFECILDKNVLIKIS